MSIQIVNHWLISTSFQRQVKIKKKEVKKGYIYVYTAQV